MNRKMHERRFGSSRRSHLGNRRPAHSHAPWVSYRASPRSPYPKCLRGRLRDREVFVEVAINNQYQRSGRWVRRVLSLVTRGLRRAPWVGQ